MASMRSKACAIVCLAAGLVTSQSNEIGHTNFSTWFPITDFPNAQQANLSHWQAEAVKVAGADLWYDMSYRCILASSKYPEVSKGLAPDLFVAPGRAFDNLYFVGTSTVTAWALDTGHGLILIDALWNPDEAERIPEDMATQIESYRRLAGIDVLLGNHQTRDRSLQNPGRACERECGQGGGHLLPPFSSQYGIQSRAKAPRKFRRSMMPGLSRVYNNLGDVFEMSESVASKVQLLQALAELVANDLHKSFDIRLNHKHFDIEDDEQVVGFAGEDMSMSVVCKDGQIPAELLAAHGLHPTPGGSIQASDLLIKGGQLIPYEFAYSLSASHHHPGISKAFLAQWSEILEKEGMEGVLGLSVQDMDVPVNAHEVSDSDARINTLYFQEAPVVGLPTVSTTWRVDNVDGIVQAKQCHWCSKIQHHGNKCD